MARRPRRGTLTAALRAGSLLLQPIKADARVGFRDALLLTEQNHSSGLTANVNPLALDIE
jgi:hypothetical protein